MSSLRTHHSLELCLSKQNRLGKFEEPRAPAELGMKGRYVYVVAIVR